ncbi:MAG TPA: ferritin [Firmicutes bacterium]|nr:ferritin [Bacillota bacterium]
MLNQEVAYLLNDQVRKEFESAYFYLDIANYYISKNLDGFGNWFQVQAQEELAHALFFVQYLQDNDYVVSYSDIKVLNHTYVDLKFPLSLTLEHEQSVTASIHNIYDKAFEVRDFRTMQFLDWFVKEQAEEEKTTQTILNRYELFGTDAKGLYLFDQELGNRTYTAPTMA